LRIISPQPGQNVSSATAAEQFGHVIAVTVVVVGVRVGT
jgi:hypothetical protein